MSQDIYKMFVCHQSTTSTSVDHKVPSSPSDYEQLRQLSHSTESILKLPIFSLFELSFEVFVHQFGFEKKFNLPDFLKARGSFRKKVKFDSFLVLFTPFSRTFDHLRYKKVLFSVFTFTAKLIKRKKCIISFEKPNIAELLFAF